MIRALSLFSLFPFRSPFLVLHVSPLSLNWWCPLKFACSSIYNFSVILLLLLLFSLLSAVITFKSVVCVCLAGGEAAKSTVKYSSK